MNKCVNSNGPVSMTCNVGADNAGVKQKHLHLIFPLPVLYIFENVMGHNFYLLKSFVCSLFHMKITTSVKKKLALILQPVVFTLTYFFVIYTLSSSAAK